MRRIYWKYYICYTFGLVVMGLHLMLKYSISYMELETEDDNSMYPRELKSPGGDHLRHENCVHHRHLQQDQLQGQLNQMDTGLVRSLTDAATKSTTLVDDTMYPSVPFHMGDSAVYRESNLRRRGPWVPGGHGGLAASNLTTSQGHPNHRLPDPARTDKPQIVPDKWLRTYLAPEQKTDQESRGFVFTCNNIDQIVIKRKLGQGVTKQVYLGQYGGGKVAVKMITRNVIDVKSCLFRLKRNVSGVQESELPRETQRCYTLPNMKLMKEILLLHQLKHPNMLKLLGYCARSEETESTSLQDHGVLAVYEYALPFYPSTLTSWPWYLRVKTAFELTDLLHYLQTSPLGSLRISDFKEIHFLLKDGRIKLTDLDDVTSLEPKCEINLQDSDSRGRRSAPLHQGGANHVNHGAKDNVLTKTCGYNLKCIGGICQGFNALHNLAHMNKHYFQQLLYGDCEDHEEMCSRVRTRLNNLDISAGQLKELLYQMMRVSYVPGYS